MKNKKLDRIISLDRKKKELDFDILLSVNAKKTEGLARVKVQLPLDLRIQVAGLKEKKRKSFKVLYLSLAEYGYQLMEDKWLEVFKALHVNKTSLLRLKNRFLRKWLFDAKVELNPLSDPQPVEFQLPEWMHARFSEIGKAINSTIGSIIRYAVYLALDDVLEVDDYDAEILAFGKQLRELEFIITKLSS